MTGEKLASAATPSWSCTVEPVSESPKSPFCSGSSPVDSWTRTFYKVQCEDAEDEDDFIAIRGVRWREHDYPRSCVLEEIEDLPPHFLDDDETSDESDGGVREDEDIEPVKHDYRFELRKPPTIEEARKALDDLRALLKPPRKDRTGYTDPKLPPVLKERLLQMKDFLWLYTDVRCDGTIHPENPVGGCWTKAADRAARNAGNKGPYLSRCLRSWSKAYINNRIALPHRKPSQKYSRIDDEYLAAELKLHLQSVGKFVRAQDIVDYLDVPGNRARVGVKKSISVRTARRWMLRMGYRWKKEPHGQYADGHERSDVVHYCQNIFLPAWTRYQSCLRKWKKDDLTIEEPSEAGTSVRRTVMWFHDESTFYANDRRKTRWVHNSEGAMPQPKGEGASLMVADFVSADYGWLQSQDGKESARVLFKAGKARDGYFTNEDILVQAAKAMEILKKDYPDEDHVLVFDNATTHLKRADDALSARKMPKGPSH
jgi:hypothetical protein